VHACVLCVCVCVCVYSLCEYALFFFFLYTTLVFYVLCDRFVLPDLLIARSGVVWQCAN